MPISAPKPDPTPFASLSGQTSATMYECKRKMAIAATQIASSYSSNSEIELPLTLMKRAETLSNSGDHKMYLFEQVSTQP
jgi:hypothetical protein